MTVVVLAHNVPNAVSANKLYPASNFFFLLIHYPVQRDPNSGTNFLSTLQANISKQKQSHSISYTLIIIIHMTTQGSVI